MNFYANILEGKENKGPVLRDPYFYQTEEEIKQWLDEMKIKNYDINDNLTVDINGDVNLYDKNINKIPIKFNKVNGNFNCNKNKMLVSLKGSPEKVNGNFNCKDCILESLKYCPTIVKGYFDCSNNYIKKIDYFPNNLGGGFFCNNCRLTTLEGLPKIINGDLNCNSNRFLSSLKGSPEIIKGGFYIVSCGLKTLENSPKKVNGNFYCNMNQLTSLDFFPLVKGDVKIHSNPIKTVKGMPNATVKLLNSISIYQKDNDIDFSWYDIAWDKANDINSIVVYLYENIQNNTDVENSKEALKRIEELQLY